MIDLHISVNNKIATFQRRDGDIVCGNSDYQIKFTFDEEWEAYENKIARFIWGGQFQDVEFTGDTCPVPILSGVTLCEVGVYAGELCTTTSAFIACKPSILCQEASPSVENDGYYANEARKYAEEAKEAAAAATESGATFTPSVAADGTLSWTNNKGLENPAPVNIKGPKGDTYTLTEADKSEIAEQAVELIDGVPSYWLSALQEGAEAINTALCTAGRNKSAFLFYSDSHWNYGSQKSPILLKYLYKHTGLTKTIFGGDIVNDEATDYDTMAYLWEWRNMIKDLPNHHSVVGNHDDGNSTNNLFSEQYVYGYLLSAEETPDIVRGEGMYYYIDHSPEKTRYLYLDTAYKGLDGTQKEFIKQALISTPSGWHIVVISHIWYIPDYDQYDQRPVPLTGLSTDATTLTAMLDAYNSRTGDYVDCGGWVEFCIGGHIHYDYDGTTETGIPIILVETDSNHTRGNYTYTAGTTTEASVNGIIADYDNHKIYIVRIGRGESREVEITNYVVNYTNVLPLALAADGTSIYNGIGYKADTRWSESGQAESTSVGDYLTGYIPVSNGDIIYCKNIDFTYADDGSGGKVLWSNALGSTSGSANGAILTEYKSATWHDDGTIASFVVVDYSYIRIQSKGITEASIITINQPIE